MFRPSAQPPLGARPRSAPRRSRSGAGRALLAAAHASLALACGAGPGAAPEGARSVVLVVVDSLRADRLGCYGAKRATSPAIDALARQSILFERAYSTSSWTQPSVASILTGRMPSGHGLQQIGNTLGSDVPTLATALAERGFATAGVVSHLLLGERFGFARGFERFDESEARGHEHVSTPGVTQRAIGMLRTLAEDERPFFLFVHYFDPHYSYMDHPEMRFARPGQGRVRGGETINEIVGLLPTLRPDELRTLRGLYDEEIRRTDDGMAELLVAIEALAPERRPVVAFTADHGEEFVDHGFVGHTYTLYEEIVRVPLIVHVPGGDAAAEGAGRRVEQPVSLGGLAPWLLELAGVDPQAVDAQSASLSLVLEQPAAARAPVMSEVDYVEWEPLGASGAAASEVAGVRESSRTRKRSLVQGAWKLVRNEASGALELFDLASDPREQRDLAAQQPERAAALAAALDREIERVGGSPAGGVAEVTPDEAAALRALGYAVP